MPRVIGHVSIYTQRTARKDHPCDGPSLTHGAEPTIRKGDPYWRAALPPHSEIGNTGWWVYRLCRTCAPPELTTKAKDGPDARA